jgi:hypothetical protein
MSHKQFMIICRVGDNSLHKEWITNTHRNFDLFISYYGDTKDKYKNDADYYEEVKGPKWPILSAIVHEHAELISRYDAVWFPDDDISMSTESICRMFNLFAGLSLKLGQPALTLDSHVAHKELIVAEATIARHVNFIEVMAPIFSRATLKELQHTFSQSTSGWGLDFLWPVLLKYQGMAIMDATPMIHTRPLGGNLYKLNTLSPRDDIENLKTLYPHLNLSKRHLPNKFHFYSTVKMNRRSQFFARLVARITRARNKVKYARSSRFGENKIR